ncbi:MAG TPA: HAMP domain-containing sensor histidine kinase [Acidobacteriaceae bacterium]|jgi:two-component system sensor histidine kinase SenX3|nr:HAMP domain-containing sensor histidine kinase [Acidobacteriaceae bacterium]
MFLFILLGVCLTGVAVALNVSWILLNWRRIVPLALGIPFFALLIAGVALNTIFLVREVRRNERHDAFLSAVTHELKTPVASIHLYLETLQRRQLDETQRRDFYARMLADSDRLMATVEQVLKAGEIGLRSRSNIRVPVDMRALAEDCVRLTRARNHLEESAITLSVDDTSLAALPMFVRGDPDELHTALLNILGNAVKYSPESASVKVVLEVKHDAWVRISVTDQGIGIPAAHLKRIFLRFYRVPNRNVLRTKGTGLGLYLVRTIARQHGGDATAESAGEGHGATVSLELPRILTPILEQE